MAMEYGENKIAKALDGKGKAEAEPSMDKSYLSAMKAFEQATTTAEKAKALKAFVMLCSDGDDE